MSIHKPSWFSDSTVMVSTALTCGLARGGRFLPKIDKVTGKRIQEKDPETSALIDAVDDQLLADVEALVAGKRTESLAFIPAEKVSLKNAVPIYYDSRFTDDFRQAMKSEKFKDFRSASIGELVEDGWLEIRGGHGSPSQDQRVGNVPYIKVSDLRAGLVNINPTNRIPLSVAKQFWRGDSSGLRAFDLVCPERTSKNIGDFCVLMPGQEQVVMTKEMIILRPGPKANFDPFYLLWALTLNIVRDQWKRVIFMQTNREDVGKRYLEIEIPIPDTKKIGEDVSTKFRNYYFLLAEARKELSAYLGAEEAHHFFVPGAEENLNGTSIEN